MNHHVDPINLTQYNRTYLELEEVIIFGVLVSGKSALKTIKLMETFFDLIHQDFNCKSHLKCLRRLDRKRIESFLIEARFGCFSNKSRSLHELANSGLDLRSCSPEDLEKIFGIGCKTSRMFILHTRPNVELAVLDTHILKFLKDKGYKCPKSTPTKTAYKKWENVFIDLAKKSGKSIAEYDLHLWNTYRVMA